MTGVKKMAMKDEDQGNLRTLHLVLLSCCITAVEAASAYSLIYAFLTLQYLGVPTSLASFNGVIGGSASTFLIPFFGTLSDRGRNPKKRKTVALALNTLNFVGACVFLMTAGILKMKESSDNYGPGPSESSSTADDYGSYLDNQTTAIFIGQNSSSVMVVASGREVVSLLPGILGFIGFSLIDFGFDLGNAVSRAFAVEFTPNAQHNTVFNVISFLAPFTASIVSIFGIFNFPEWLDTSFHIDGTAATLFIFSLILITVAISSTAVSISTSRWLERRKKFEHKSPSVGVFDTSLLISNKGGPGTLSKEKRAFRQSFDSTLDGFSTALFTLSYQREYQNNTIDENLVGNTSERQPLLVANRRNSRHTSGTYDGSISYYDVKEDGFIGQIGQKEGHIEENSQPSDRGIRVDVLKESSTQGNAKNPRFFTRRLVILIMSTFVGYASMSAFSNFSSLSVTTGIYHGDPLASLGSEGRQLYNTGLQRAAVGNTLMFVSCFTASSLNKYLIRLMGPRLMYFTFQLLHSTATVAHIVFQREEIYYLAMVVFGLFRYAIFTIPFMMANDFTNESMKAVQRVFVAYLALYAMTFCTAFLVQMAVLEMNGNDVEDAAWLRAKTDFNHINVSELEAAMNGVKLSANRGAWKTSKIKTGSVTGYGDNVQKPTDKDKDKDTTTNLSKTGRVISIIGILCPINYLITCALTGPVIDQTGNVWFPMIYSASGGFLSAILFLPLFFLKDRH